MENRAHALAAGIFVLLMLVATTLAILWFRQDHEARSRYVLETRQNVGGLNKEATVRYRGIRAGQVEEIELDPKDPRLVLVRINLDQDFQLTRGTTASLAVLGMTGLTYIALEDDGSNPEPLLGRPGELPRITLRPALFDSLSRNAGDMLQQLSRITARLEVILSDKNAANLERSIGNLAQVTDGLRSTLSPENLQRINQVLANVEKTTGEAAPLAQELRQLVARMNQLTQRAEGLVGGEQESGAATGTRSTMARANQTFDELSRTARQLSRVLDAIEDQPQALVFGRQPPRPGPGEAGFNATQGAPAQ